MSGLTRNKQGRPKGTKDRRKRKPRSDTKAAMAKRSAAAKKAAATRRRQRAEKEAAIKKGAPDLDPQKKRPDVERPDVEVTPYPRAGESADFVAFLDQVRSQSEHDKARRESERTQAANPIEPAEPLSVKDVAEWVAWPFLVWSQSQKMQSLMLSDAEAASLAEPLTSILNRHGAGDLIPPDYLDGLKLAARATPVMTQRFSLIKAERQKRGGQGGPQPPGPAAEHGGSSPVQGAPMSKPKEV